MFEQYWIKADRLNLGLHLERKDLAGLVPLLVASLVLSSIGSTEASGKAGQGVSATIDTRSKSTIRQRSDRIPAMVPAKISYVGDAERELLVFEFDSVVRHVLHLDGDQLIVWFDHIGRFDLEEMAIKDATHLRQVEALGGEVTRWVILHLAPESGYRDHIEEGGHRLTIEFGPKHAFGKASNSGIRMANVQRRGAASIKQRGNEWVPRKRTTPKPTPDAVQRKNGIANPGNNQVHIAAAPRVLSKQVGRADLLADSPDAKKQATAKAAANSSPIPSASAEPAPGQFDIDEAALDRALERTLTREGAVLLSHGMVEIEPSLSYVRREFDAPTLINLFGFAAFGETVVRRNEVNAILAARAGLPFDSQIEFDVPYRYVDQSSTTMMGFTAIEETDDSASAFGDIGLGVAKTLLRENHWWPDAVARVRWDSATGKSDENGVALGGGAHEVTGSLSVVKSQDPLAFFGSIAYEKTFEENDIDRGDRLGFSAGTVLAASPDTSLRVSVRQDFIGDAEVNGEEVAGSDRMAATLRLGASSVLGQGVMLDASVDVGLTEDAPDYAARISLPIRFRPSSYWAFGSQSRKGEGELSEGDETPSKDGS